MKQIRDALELLTAQHEEIDALLERVTHTRDAKAFAALADKLTAHLALEQELLYPVIARYVSLGVLDELLAEHVAIKRTLGKLLWLDGDDPERERVLDRLTHLLVGHAAWQEYELFETLAEHMSADELAALCTQLHAFERYAVAA